MSFTLRWDINANDWASEFQKLEDTNLLQCLPYAKAQAILNQQKFRLGVIEVDGQVAGLCVLLEAGIVMNAIHAVIFDRGPLWMAGYGTPDHQRAFFTELNRQFPKRFGRKRRVIPELADTKDNREMMKVAGFSRSALAGYQTLDLDLRPDMGALRASLKKSWRGSLQKAESHAGDFKIEWDSQCNFLHWFLKIYAMDKAEKGYSGASAKTLITMAKTFGRGIGQDGGMLIGRVFYKDQPMAAVLLLCHGRGATYQAGWNKPPRAYRNMGAHNLLLWDAIRVLKERGCTHFDLGGINEDHAFGVSAFKRGLAGKKHGTEITLVGLYS